MKRCVPVHIKEHAQEKSSLQHFGDSRVTVAVLYSSSKAMAHVVYHGCGPIMSIPPAMGIPFNVQIFPGCCISVHIPMERYLLGECHAMHLKQVVGQALGLKEESLHIFGIYTGPLREPIELCADNYPLMNNISQLSFQRLACSRVEELAVIADDERALHLVFWELKYRCEYTVRFPRPSKDEEKCRDYQHKFARACLSSNSVVTQLCLDYVRCHRNAGSLNKMQMVSQAARTVPSFYMVYSNVVPNCILRYTLATSPPVKRGTRVHVVLDTTALVVLNLSGEELISWTWDTLCIESPGMTPWPVWHPMYRPPEELLSPPASPTSEANVDEVANMVPDGPSEGVSFITQKCLYIYSVSLYYQREYYDRGEID